MPSKFPRKTEVASLVRGSLFLLMCLVSFGLGVTSAAAHQQTLSSSDGSSEAEASDCGAKQAMPSLYADRAGIRDARLAQAKGRRPKKRQPKKAKAAPTEEQPQTNGEEEAQQPSEPAPATGALLRGSRMEFDARLIRGETAGAGAVFLFQRTPRVLPSMVEMRTGFLEGTVRTMLGEEWERQFKQAKAGKD